MSGAWRLDLPRPEGAFLSPAPGASEEVRQRQIRDFDRVVGSAFDDLLALHPDWATQLGVHRHDARLPDLTPEARAQESGIWRRLTSALDALGPLLGERALDRDLAGHLARLQQFRLETLRLWAKTGDAADTLGSALFPLFTRDFAPAEERYALIAARLRGASTLLQQSRAAVSAPVRRWNETALESCRSLPEFLDAILGQASAEVRNPTLLSDLQRAATAARAALAGYARWLEEAAITRGDEEYRVGAEAFAELVRLRELGLTPDNILEIGQQGLRDTQAERRRLAALIDRDAAVERVAAAVREDAPRDFPSALDAYRAAIRDCRAFVADQDLATLPTHEELVVMETPGFLRPVLPFAAYFSPATFDPVRRGVYVVTPPDGDAERMGEHNFAAILNTSVHEGYPGHHLQFSCAAENPSLLRLLVDAPEFVEGWAFYCEQLMLDHGFHDTPRRRFVQATDLTWRAARIVCDVGLSCRTMDFEQAVTFLVSETAMGRAAARAEVARYVQTPTYPLSYFLGKVFIQNLRRDAERAQANAFRLKTFHDRLLYAGTLPIAYLRRLVLG